MNLIHTYKQTNTRYLWIFFLFKVSFGCFPRDAIKVGDREGGAKKLTFLLYTHHTRNTRDIFKIGLMRR